MHGWRGEVFFHFRPSKQRTQVSRPPLLSWAFHKKSPILSKGVSGTICSHIQTLARLWSPVTEPIFRKAASCRSASTQKRSMKKADGTSAYSRESDRENDDSHLSRVLFLASLRAITKPRSP